MSAWPSGLKAIIEDLSDRLDALSDEPAALPPQWDNVWSRATMAVQWYGPFDANQTYPTFAAVTHQNALWIWTNDSYLADSIPGGDNAWVKIGTIPA